MLWRKPAAAAVSSVEGEAQSPVVVDPTKVGDEVFSDHIYEKKDTAAKIDTPLALRFISIVQRLTDNAVAIKELRARLRGKLEAKNLKMSAVIAVAVSIAMLMAPTITGAIGGGIGQAFYGPPVTPLSLTASGTLVLWYMGILYMSVMLGMMFMGTAFAPETQKSTLGFLLLTPMKAASIVFGKAVGLLLSSGYTIGLLWLWTLVLSLAFSPTLGLASVLRVWGYVTATSFAVIMAVGACALAFAALTARSKKLAGCGVLALVLLPQVFIQLFIQLSVRRRRGGFRRRRPLNLPFHLDGPRLWMIFIVVCLVVSLIGFAVAVFGVRRMRKGDIVFEGAKQDN
jgi:ABC-type Na+ efflux pump permease subunit